MDNDYDDKSWMIEHFVKIKEVYDDFYKFLMVKHGMFPVKDTGVGYWGVSVSEEIFDLFKHMQLERYNHLIDLGSGDGKVAMIASLFTKATGIEYDNWLHEVSLDVKSKLMHVPHVNRCEFVNGDYMEHDLSVYDVAFLNPDKASDEVFKRLMDGFKGKVVLYGPHHKPEVVSETDHVEINGTHVSIFDL